VVCGDRCQRRAESRAASASRGINPACAGSLPLRIPAMPNSAARLDRDAIAIGFAVPAPSLLRGWGENRCFSGPMSAGVPWPLCPAGIVNLTRSSRPSWPLSLERGQPYRRAKDFSAPNRRATNARRIPPLLKLTMPQSAFPPAPSMIRENAARGTVLPVDTG